MLERAVDAVFHESDGELSAFACKRIARAVLMAVREPDAWVRGMGVEAWDLPDGHNDGMIPIIAYTAMIDAILTETPA